MEPFPVNSGGVLAGFVPSAVICGFAKSTPARSYPVVLFFCVIATAVTLACGTALLAYLLQISIGKALAVGIIPFLPGAALKCLGAAFIYRFLAVRRLIPA